MAADFQIFQGNTLPAFTWPLEDAGGTTLDLTDAISVNWVMRSLTSLTPTINAPAAVVNAEQGLVSYAWTSTDTQTAGLFTGQFVVTYPSGTQSAPGDGYIEISIEENLSTAGGQTIVSLGEVKEYLRMSSNDRTNDPQLIRFIRASVPVIEAITGPVIQQTFEERHDGGSPRIVLRRRPSTALGTSPVLIVNAISEYNGPIEWPLAMVSTLDEATLYSVIVEPQRGIITRTTAGGGVQNFPNMPESVHVWYTAGQQTVPDNIREANLELLRVNYQGTQQRAAVGWGNTTYNPEDNVPSSTPMGFFVPGRVRELLAPNRRAPAVA